MNPTLVYRVRGAPVETVVENRGVYRAAAGAALMVANAAVAWPLMDYLRGASHSLIGPVAATLWLAYGSLRFLSFYAAHSGLASVHLGLMRMLGWDIPERYCYPMLATNPMDFWRRWNTYVRVWLEAYVFLPMARRLARRTKRPAGQVVAAVATLVASGLIHDAYVFAGRQTFGGLPMTRLFLSAGLLLLVWRLVANVRQVLGARFGKATPRSLDMATTLVSRFSLACAIVGAAIAWG